MNTQKQSLLIVFFMVTSILLSAPNSRADVDGNINVGTPPPVVLSSPPRMLFLAEAGVYVAVGTGHDIFFTNGHYYTFHDGAWFSGPGYGGPWVHARHQSLPPGLRKHKVHHLRMLRDQNHKAFKKHPKGFKGKHFIGHKGPGPKAKSKMRGSGHKKGGPMKNKGRQIR